MRDQEHEGYKMALFFGAALIAAGPNSTTNEQAIVDAKDLLARAEAAADEKFPPKHQRSR